MTRYESELMHHGVKEMEWYVKHGPPYPLKEGAFEGKPKSVNKQKRARVEANEEDRDPKKKKKKKEEDKDLKKASSADFDGDTKKDESEKPGGGLKYRTDNPEKEIQKLKDLFADGRIKDWGYDPKTGEFDVRGIDKRTYTRLRKENGIESRKPFKLQKDQDLVAQKIKAKEDEKEDSSIRSLWRQGQEWRPPSEKAKEKYIAKQEQKKLKLEAKLEKQKAKAVEAQAKADREAAERAAKAEKEAAERAAKAEKERAERDKKFMKGQKSTDDLNILTNDELERRTARLNLEKNYLSAMKDARPTNEVIKPLLKDLGKKTVTSFATAATVALGEKVFENLFDGKKTKKISFTDYFK